MDEVAKEKTKEYDPAKCPFSWDKLDGLLHYKSSLDMCADLLDTTNTTIKNHIKRRYGLTFTEYSERKLSGTKFKLVQKAIQMALAGDRVMLIFCLKNICRWQDKIEDEVKEVTPVLIEIVKEKYDKIAG